MSDRFLRRFIKKAHCRLVENADGKLTWRVDADLFNSNETKISFHKRPVFWSEQNIDVYRRTYVTQHDTIPGVLQINEEIFDRMQLPAPFEEFDHDDKIEYATIHCSWFCQPDLSVQLASEITGALEKAIDAEVLFNTEKLKKSPVEP